MVNVIKRGKRPDEPFDIKKLSASLRAACLSAKSPEGLASDLADATAKSVLGWTARKSDITTTDIRAQASKFLAKNHPDAAYLYEHHKKMM